MAEEERPIYTETQLRELLQAESDRRVNGALRKREREYEAALAEAVAEARRAALEEESAKRAAVDSELASLRERLAAAEEAAREREAYDAAAAVLAEAGAPAALAPFAVAGDAETSAERAKALAAAFSQAVSDECSRRMRPARPLPEAEPGSGLDRERFRSMSLAERQRLHDRAPDVFAALTAKRGR
jgi:hypothetical protein